MSEKDKMHTNLPPSGRVALSYAGHRYSALYCVIDGVLTVRSPLGTAQVAMPDPQLGPASAASMLLRQIVVRTGKK